MLTLYRFPPAFDERMNKKARRMLSWCIPLFCFSAIWAYGNPNVLEKTNIVEFDAKTYANNVTDRNLDSYFGPVVMFFNRGTNLYGVPFFVILIIYVALFILGFLFSNVLGLIFNLIFGCCKVKLKKDKTKKDMWYDARVATNEMSDEFDLYNSLD